MKKALRKKKQIIAAVGFTLLLMLVLSVFVVRAEDRAENASGIAVAKSRIKDESIVTLIERINENYDTIKNILENDNAKDNNNAVIIICCQWMRLSEWADRVIEENEKEKFKDSAVKAYEQLQKIRELNKNKWANEWHTTYLDGFYKCTDNICTKIQEWESDFDWTKAIGNIPNATDPENPTPITNVGITVPNLEIGNKPEKNIENIKVESPDEYKVERIIWTPADTKTFNNRSYTVTLTLGVKFGYIFTENTDATINDQSMAKEKINVINNGEGAILIYEFELTSPINEVEIEVPQPEIDYPLATIENIKTNPEVTIVNVEWNTNDAEFEANVQHTVTLTIKAKFGYIFTKNTTAAINGQSVDVEVEEDGKQAKLSYTFKKLPSPTASSGNNNPATSPNNDNPSVESENDFKFIRELWNKYKLYVLIAVAIMIVGVLAIFYLIIQSIKKIFSKKKAARRSDIGQEGDETPNQRNNFRSTAVIDESCGRNATPQEPQTPVVNRPQQNSSQNAATGTTGTTIKRLGRKPTANSGDNTGNGNTPPKNNNLSFHKKPLNKYAPDIIDTWNKNANSYNYAKMSVGAFMREFEKLGYEISLASYETKNDSWKLNGDLSAKNAVITPKNKDEYESGAAYIIPTPNDPILAYENAYNIQGDRLGSSIKYQMTFLPLGTVYGEDFKIEDRGKILKNN